jgi:hypothetical protein
MMLIRMRFLINKVIGYESVTISTAPFWAATPPWRASTALPYSILSLPTLEFWLTMRIRIQLFTTKEKKEERPEERENTLLPGNYLNVKRTKIEKGDNISRLGEEVSLTHL